MRSTDFCIRLCLMGGLLVGILMGCDAECDGSNPLCRKVARVELSCSPTSVDPGEMVVCRARNATYDTLRWSVSPGTTLGDCKNDTSCGITMFTPATYKVTARAKVNSASLGTQRETKRSDSANFTVVDPASSSTVAPPPPPAPTLPPPPPTPFVAEGALDTSFASNGFLVQHNTAGGNGGDAAADVKIDTSGTIWASGLSTGGTATDDYALWKVSSDGDTVTPFTHHSAAPGAGNDLSNSVFIDSSGRAISGGSSENTGPNDDVAFWYHNSDISLYTSFNISGILTSNALNGGTNEFINDVMVDDQGRVIAVGSADNGGNFDLLVLRLNPDGTADSTWDSDGVVIHDNAAGGSGDDEGKAVIIDNSNRIVVVGNSFGSGTLEDLAIWRFNTDGSLDTSFNSTGFVTHNGAAGGSGDDDGRDIVLDSNDRLVVVGRSFGSMNEDLAIWRYNATGTLDTSFNDKGFVTHNGAAGGNGRDVGEAVVFDALQNIVVAGYSFKGTNDDMVVWRFTRNGDLDTSFAGGIGFFVHSNAAGGNGDDQALGLALDSSGRLVVAGKSIRVGPNDDMVIWRLQ